MTDFCYEWASISFGYVHILFVHDLKESSSCEST